jgi:hypothetical protein
MAGAGIRTDIAGYGRGVSRYGRSAGAQGMGLALTARRFSSLDADLSQKLGARSGCFPLLGGQLPSPRTNGQRRNASEKR